MATRILKTNYLKSQGVVYEFDTESDILGEGGMGRVYIGTMKWSNGQQRKVAIKAMFEGLPTSAIERAEREASIQLSSDYLVRMYDFISTADKDEFGAEVIHYHVISEYLEGITLDDFVHGRLKGRDGVINDYIQRFYNEYMEDIEGVSTQIIKQILSGVMALHDKGYIHRDIDPSNIMLTYDGRIKLIDFGIAKPVKRLSTLDKELTATGQFLGKAGYASPELVLGDVKNQTFATDVYAIGVLYFYLITGHLPFEGSNYDMINAHLHKRIPLREISSRQISEVIRRATEKNIDERYATAAQMRAAIDAFRFPERWYQNKSTIARYAATAIGAICVALVVINLTVSIIEKMKNVPEQKEQTVTVISDADRYKSALAMISKDESLLSGIDSMNILANQGYAPAMYEMARTFLALPQDQEGSARRDRMAAAGFKAPDENSMNDRGMDWLTQYIASTEGSHDLKALLYLGSIYLNGEVVATNLNEAKACFEKGYQLAKDSGNKGYESEFSKGLRLVEEQMKANKK